MAIKGLTPQLAERGKLKIGGLGDERKKQGSNETYRLPVKHDYFTITTMTRDQAGRLMEDTALMQRFKEAQGAGTAKLTEIPVRLLYDEIDLNFQTRYAVYKGKTCWCTGDGEVACRQGQGIVREGDGDNIRERQAMPTEYGMVVCPCERCDPTYDKPDKCKTLGTLSVLLQGVDRIGGVWKFRTTSYNSVTAILSSLTLIKTLTGGPLAGIPLHMVLTPKTVTVPAGRQAGQSMVVYVVSLEFRGPEEKLTQIGYEIRKRQIENRVRMDQIEAQAQKLLVAPHQESVEEQAATAAEFYPEADPENVVTIPKETKPAAAKKDRPAQAKAATAPGPAATQETQAQEAATLPEQAPVTLPELMEMVKKADGIMDLPFPLVTTKGVHIGRCLNWGPNLAQEMVLTLELIGDLEEATRIDGARGLTAEDIKKHFLEAGINVAVVSPADTQEGQERTEKIDEPGTSVAAAAYTRERPAGNGGRGAARKSLF